jgi:NitT/TauT family transport system ATP-binding protein
VTALVGPSGCGKSTLLRVVAGLVPLDEGRVVGVPDAKAFVFQDAALLPWLTVRENVGLPGRYRAIGDIDEALEMVGLEGLGGRLPRTLSGGQKMRVSIARALVARPNLVLLDEAFAALDGVTRREVQASFLALQEELGWTVLMVTHELEDATRLADRVIALGGPPLRVLDDVTVFTPRPRSAPDAAVLERLARRYTA